jgi:hypothetical protein
MQEQVKSRLTAVAANAYPVIPIHAAGIRTDVLLYSEWRLI